MGDVPEIHNIGVISKPRSERAAEIIPELTRWLKDRLIEVRIDAESAAYAGRADGYTREDLAHWSDMLVVLGGDGTLLSTARASIARDLPVFAVNLGGLGFLTAIKLDELYPQLEQALTHPHRIGRRRMLHADLWRAGRPVSSWEALNDTVFSKTEIARMIELEVNVDSNLVCVYRADGLIIATPTGSTAYSLSAGGPIMFPSVAAISITPICPHMLTNRPVIMPDDAVIEIVPTDAASTYLTIDGQVGVVLEQGDRVVCRRSEYFLNLIQPPDLRFFDVLREKLGWGGR